MLRKLLVTLALGAALAMNALAAAAPAADKGVTVGEFLQRVAAAAGVPARDPMAAMERLRGLGAAGDYQAGSPLTYEIVARIAADLGVAVTRPANTGGPISVPQATLLAAYIGSNSMERGLPTVDDAPNQCLSSVNRGACVDCCKEATGLTGKFCGRFCHANVFPPPSPREPQP